MPFQALSQTKQLIFYCQYLLKGLECKGVRKIVKREKSGIVRARHPRMKINAPLLYMASLLQTQPFDNQQSSVLTRVAIFRNYASSMKRGGGERETLKFCKKETKSD